MAAITKIELYAKEWFQKSYGNSYFNVKVYVNDIYVGQSGYEYGYGSQYEQAGEEILVDAGYIKLGMFQRLPAYCRENNIELIRNISSVRRERDLKAFIAA